MTPADDETSETEASLETQELAEDELDGLAAGGPAAMVAPPVQGA